MICPLDQQSLLPEQYTRPKSGRILGMTVTAVHSQITVTSKCMLQIYQQERVLDSTRLAWSSISRNNAEIKQSNSGVLRDLSMHATPVPMHHTIPAMHSIMSHKRHVVGNMKMLPSGNCCLQDQQPGKRAQNRKSTA